MIASIRPLAIGLVLGTVLANSTARAVTYVGIDLYMLQAPAGLPNFSGLDAFGGQIGGRASPPLSDNFHAILWSGPAGTLVDLTPSGFVTAQVNGLVSGQQVGSFTPEVTIGAFGPHAAIWSGTPGSLVSLNPASGLTTSVAIATDGSRQVGYVTAVLSPGPRFPEAALWSGTAVSVVNLYPAGYSQSQANAVRDGQQAGQAATGGGNHAMLWTGTAAWAVDLNPAGAASSFAPGVGGGQQVGVVNFPGFSSHAALWSGSAASLVDLSPVGLSSTVLSEALDVRGGVQVGFVHPADVDHAYLWTGSAASAIDLSLLLPAGLQGFSRAQSIDASGNIFGIASDASGHVHAVEWSTVPEPSSIILASIGMALLARNRIGRMWRLDFARMRARSPGLIVFAFLLMEMFCLRASQAAIPNTWQTAGGGSWNTGGNWKTGNPPTASEDAIIDQIATSIGSPASVTLDASQTAYGLTLNPGGGKAIHIDPGSSPTNTLTLLSTDTSTDGASTFFSVYAINGIGNAINASIQLGNGNGGSFTAVISSFDPAFAINGGLSQSPGQTWRVRIVGNNQGVVDYATTLKTYSGDTTIGTTGILQIDKEDSIPHGIGEGIVSIEGNGRLQFGAATSQSINALSSSSTTAVVTKPTGAGSATLSINGRASATFAGSITNPSGVGLLNLSKSNTGTEILTGTNSYRGTTTVSGGTLLVDGTHNSAGSYSVTALGAILGGILGGRGTINLASGSSVNATSGRIAAGDGGPGIFNINGTLNMSGFGGLNIELGGNSPGNGSGFYDQVNMTSPSGAINASFAHFSASLVNGFAPQPNNVFYVLTRADSGSFSGTQPFDAFPEGAAVNFGGGFSGKVTYQADWTGNQATSTLTGGNDMAFYNIVVPEPAGAILLGLGMLCVLAKYKRRA